MVNLLWCYPRRRFKIYLDLLMDKNFLSIQSLIEQSEKLWQNSLRKNYRNYSTFLLTPKTPSGTTSTSNQLIGKNKRSSSSSFDPNLGCRHLQEDVILITDAWVDLTYQLDADDPFKTNYGAGPFNFWQNLVTEVIQTNGIHILDSHFFLFSYRDYFTAIRPE